MKNHITYCLTINRPTSENQTFQRIMSEPNGPAYAIIGYEGYRPGKTPHYQVVLAFLKPTPWVKVKEIFPRAHIEQLLYDFDLAVEYCKKENVYTELGNIELARKLNHTFLTQIKLRKKIESAGDKGVVSVTPAPALSRPYVYDPKYDEQFIIEYEKIKKQTEEA